MVESHSPESTPRERAAFRRFADSCFAAAERGVSFKSVGAPSSAWPRRSRVDDDDSEELRAAQEEIRANPKAPLVAEHLPMIAKGLVTALRDEVIKPMHERVKRSEERIAELALVVKGKALAERELLERVKKLEAK